MLGHRNLIFHVGGGCREQDTKHAKSPTHWIRNHAGYTALKLPPPRHRPVPIQPPCTHSVSLTCTYSICACIHGVLSLQDWSNGDLSLDLQCPMPNTIMTAHSKGAPCPTPPTPYPHPVSMYPQSITNMYIQRLDMYAGGVVSARLEQWRPVAGPPLPNAQHIGDGHTSMGRSLPARALSRLPLASTSVQPQLLMFLNTFVMHAGGVASGTLGALGEGCAGVFGALAKLPTQNPT
jgi:hypothetical protein